MTDIPTDGVKPKKSVALSGVTAGNTALCTVGSTGNDLHYRGYDILDIAERVRVRGDRVPAGPREIAQRGRSWPPTRAKLKALRALPPAVLAVLEQLPAASHPMDVLRTGVSALGCCVPEAAGHPADGRARYRRSAAGLPGLDAVLLAPLRGRRAAHRACRPTMIRSARISCICCTAESRRRTWVRAMHTSLILYAEHEFNASTFTARVIAGTGSDLYSCITGAIGALRGPKHGGANEVAFEIQSRYPTAGCGRSGHQAPRRRQGGHHRLRPSGLHDRRSAQSGDQGSRARAGASRRTTPADSRSPSASRAVMRGDQEHVLRIWIGSPPCPTT